MKKKKTLHIMVVVLLLLLTAGCTGGYMYDRKENSEKAEEAAGMVVEEGQESVYVKITDIAGNEISYVEISQEEVDALYTGDSQISATSDFNGKTPLENESIKNHAPSTDSVEMPYDEMPFENEGMKETEELGKSEETEKTIKTEETIKSEETEKTKELEETEETIIIPVGTAVITKLGTKTTFSRLASGDIIQIKQDIDTKEILEIWIVG